MIASYLVFAALIFGRGYANNYEIQKLTMEFFESQVTLQFTIFACWNTYEQLSFYRQYAESRFKVAYVPIPTDVLDMAKILTVNYYTLGILLDLECPQSNFVLGEFSRQQLPFNNTYRWLLVTKLDAPPIDILKDLPLTIDTEMTLSVKNGSDYILYDVYNPSHRHGGLLNVTLMGNWNPDRGLDIRLTQYKYQRRRNLAGLSINVSLALTHEPTPDFETYITSPINRHEDTMHRYHYALIRHLGDYYNFTINLQRTDSWGYLTNGTFNGMLGDLAAGTVDIGGSPLRFKHSRMNVADFTSVQTYTARASFIFRHPKTSTVRNGFLKPFTNQVWWLTMNMAVLNWILLWFTAKVENYFHNSAPTCTLNTIPASETALIATAALCQQGLSDGPQLYSGRVVFLSLFLWALLLFQYYSASIVGSLLAEPSRYIHTLRDLLESDLAVGIQDIAYNYDHFATTTDQDALELYERKVAPGRGRKQAAYFSVREGVRRVQKGNFAFQVDVVTAYKIIEDEFTEDEICDLHETQLFRTEDLGTVLRKHSPFKKMVSYGMRQIVEHGMAERQKRVWQYECPRCPESHSLNPVAVPIEESSPAMFLLLIGSLVATAILFGEYYVSWRSRRNSKIKALGKDVGIERPQLFTKPNVDEIGIGYGQ